jgi:hypothetical protein
MTGTRAKEGKFGGWVVRYFHLLKIEPNLLTVRAPSMIVPLEMPVEKSEVAISIRADECI